MNITISNYFTRYLSDSEYNSYFKYINGNENEKLWMSKVIEQVEPLLQMQLRCDKCNSYINIEPSGLCYCNDFNDNNHIKHDCSDIVIEMIRLYLLRL